MTIEVDGVAFDSRYEAMLPPDEESEIQPIRSLFHVHEAGHTVLAWMTPGLRVHGARLTPEAPGDVAGYTRVTNLHRVDIPLGYYAAGERAIDRWLRERGEWTPRLAVAAEVTALMDREKYNWREGAHDEADELLAGNWESVVRVAEALLAKGKLSRRQIGKLIR